MSVSRHLAPRPDRAGGLLLADAVVAEERPRGFFLEPRVCDTDTVLAVAQGEVEVDGGSKVAGIMGTDEFKVNSYHHQAIKDLASGLVAVACSPDGVMEAVESSDLSKRWMIGVQWHAEAMRDAGPEHRKLFEAHVSAAERHALRHAAA